MRVLSIAVVLGLAGVGRADPARSLQDAQRHFADLDFEVVLADTDAVVRDPAASVADRTNAWFLRGSALVVLDREADASAAFDSLLAVDPAFRPPAATPPRIRASFEGARAARLVRLEEELETRDGAQLRAVGVDVTAPATARGGLPLRLHVRVTDPRGLIGRFVLGYRRDSDRDYASISAPAAPSFDLVIPGSLLASNRDYKLAWYVQGLHASGARVRKVGDESEPRWIAVAAGQVPKPPGLTSHWWFWTGVAVLTATAVTVPILIVRSRDVGPQQVVLGR